MCCEVSAYLYICSFNMITQNMAKSTMRPPKFGYHIRNRICHDRGGPAMACMPLHNDRTARSYGACRIAASRRKSKWKVTGPKYQYGSDTHIIFSDVTLSLFGIGQIDTSFGIEP